MRGSWVGISAGLVLVWVAPVFPHETEIVRCDRNIKIESVKKIGERINQNGTISEFYDRNGDDQIDIEAISHIHAVKRDGAIEYEHDPHPFLYIVDLDFDGIPDATYVDKSGVGKCEDIVLYQDLTKPHGRDRDNREYGKL